MATERAFIPVRIAVLTVSDSRSLAEDRSGQTLADRIAEAGHILAARDIVTDDQDKIRDKVLGWSKDDGIDVVITTGGTGFTGRDVTPEALEPIFEKRMGRHPEGTARLSPHALQFRGDHAPAGRAPAARQFLTTATAGGSRSECRRDSRCGRWLRAGLRAPPSWCGRWHGSCHPGRS